MTLALRYWPDLILRAPCAPVAEVNDEIRQLAKDMFEVMYANDGVGLAAPQVGHKLRLFVLDVWWPDTHEYNQGRVFINPVVTPGKIRRKSPEGCLSLPGIRELVERSATCHVTALNEKGETFSLEASGLLAVCIQHENDHLDGVTMVDRVGPMTRRLLKKILPSRPPPR